MKKFLSTLTAAVCVLACAFAFTACGGESGGNDNQTHTTHNWSTTYTQDGDRHYQTCGGCTEKQYNNHDYGTSGTCVCGKEKPVTTVEVTGVTLNESELTLEIGGTETLTAVVKPDNATDKTVTYTVGPTGIVTVDNNGNVTAVAAGTATITATAANNKTATCTVTVNAPLTNADVMKYLNDMNFIKRIVEGEGGEYVASNVKDVIWYVTKDGKNITGANLLFTYQIDANRLVPHLDNIIFNEPLTQKSIIENKTVTSTISKLYSNIIFDTIQAEHTDLTNAICDKLFGAKQNAIRYIIDGGFVAADPQLGDMSTFTVIELFDKGIKENSIAISYAKTDSGLIEKLNDNANYRTYGEEKNVAITGEKLENNSEPFFGNSAD